MLVHVAIFLIIRLLTRATDQKLKTEKIFTQRSLDYVDRHIEVDNRLSWFLGALDKKYGKRAYYVHLIRKRDEVAASFANRGVWSVLFAFTSGVLQHHMSARNFNEQQRYEARLQYWDTVKTILKCFCEISLIRK